MGEGIGKERGGAGRDRARTEGADESCERDACEGSVAGAPNMVGTDQPKIGEAASCIG